MEGGHLKTAADWAFEQRLEEGNRLIDLDIRTIAKAIDADPADFAIAPIAQDLKENADLIYMGASYGVRHRMPGQRRYKGEAIFREIPGTGKREWSKLLNGYGDYTFYAFLNDTLDGYESWWLLDNETIRRAHRSGWECSRYPQEVFFDGKEKGNKGFVAIKLDGFPSYPPLVLASSEPKPGNTDGLCDACRRSSLLRRAGID